MCTRRCGTAPKLPDNVSGAIKHLGRANKTPWKRYVYGFAFVFEICFGVDAPAQEVTQEGSVDFCTH